MAGRLHVADEALQVEKDARRQRATEFAVAQAYKLSGVKDKHPLEDDDLGVHVGDMTTVNNSGSALPAMLLSALLGAAGAGGVYWWLNSDEEPAPEPVVQKPVEFNQQDYVIKPGVPDGWQPTEGTP